LSKKIYFYYICFFYRTWSEGGCQSFV